MDTRKMPRISVAVKEVAAYGQKLAAVFHQYALIVERIPSGFEGATNILDATVASVNQVSSLLKDEEENALKASSKRHFSPQGILYVRLLISECAKTLAKVQPIVVDACLPRKEYQAKAKRDKKELKKNGQPIVLPSELELDEKVFLENVVNTKWSIAIFPLEECMERLYDLQLHLLLVCQVVTVGVLSKDLSAGKVDIKSIVTYHDRIVRTADLVGIDVPQTIKASHKKRHDSSSDSDSSDSDSDNIEIISIKPKKKVVRKYGNSAGSSPSPPPPPPGNFVLPPPPSARPLAVPEPPRQPASSPWDPPSYSESKNPPTSPNGSTLLGTNSASSVTDEKPKPLQAPVFPNDKKSSPPTEVVKETQITKPIVDQPRLFDSKSNTIKFRIRSLFSSKEALAAEMRRVLCDADSHLLAFVIQRHDMRQVPHTAFHSLEATHMKTILSQLNDNTWYENFTTLNQQEHSALHRVMYPFAEGKVHQREVVVLKVLKEERRLNAWVALLKELLHKNPFPPMSGGRVLLAIVREKLVDGKPVVAPHRNNMPPPPPPPPFMSAPIVPAVRPPPLPCVPKRTTISDLSLPRLPGPPPPPAGGPYPPRPQGPPPRGMGGPPPPPAANYFFPPGSSPPGQRSNSIRISDTTPLTDYDAVITLTTYNEYTVRLSEPLEPRLSRSWGRVAITQESAERHLVQQRVQQFQRSGGNVIEAKLRLTEDQSGQVTRIMDDLKCFERDARFEWCWVEISIYNPAGEITDFVPKGQGNVAASATLMHLVAKRTPKPHCKPIELYNSLMRGPGPAPGPGRPPVPRPTMQSPPPVKIFPKKYASDSSSIDSDSDSTSWSSDSSVGVVRRKLRKYKAKKTTRTRKGKGRKYNSDSDSDSESEAEDTIKVKVEMKKGDDVVKKLLEMWTPQ